MSSAAQVLSSKPQLNLVESLEATARRLARGDVEGAASEAKALVDDYPFHPGAWFLLGTALLRTQNAGAALPALEQAARVRPAFAPHQLWLGKAYETCGRQDQALDAFARAVWLAPDDLPAHINYGRLLLLLRRSDAGYRHVRRALALILGNAGRRVVAGIVLAARCHRIAAGLIRRRGRGGLPVAVLEVLAERAQSEERFAAAARLATRALRRLPDDARLQAASGRALLAMRDFVPATRALRDALSSDPNDPDLLIELAYAETRTVWHDAAQAHLEHALELGLRSTSAKRRAGFVLLDLGRPDDAIRLFREILERDPADADGAYGLGLAHQRIGRLEEGAGWLAKALELRPTHVEAIWPLALSGKHGQSRLDLSRIEALLESRLLSTHRRMLAHFAAGRVRDAMGDHRAAFAHYVAANRLKDVSFDPDGEAQRIAVIKRTFDRPFFERVRGAGVDDQRPVFIVGLPRSGTTLLEQMIASHPSAHGAGELEDVPRLALELLPSIHDTAGAPAKDAEVRPQDVRTVGQAYLRALDQRAPQAERVVDKMPMNVLHMGLIAAALPGCRFIHCRRDPMDACLSMYILHFRGNYPFAYDLENLGLYWRLYDDLMAHWRAVLPVRMLEVDYETLVEDPETTMRGVLEFCGLPWDAQCLAFHTDGRLVRTSSFAQVRQPIYRSAVGGWRRFETELEPLRRALAGEGSPQQGTGAQSRSGVIKRLRQRAESA
jgi:tetratricopeptide (TPR) repeat protein